MSVKFLRRETARKCPVHASVMDEVQDQLIAKAYFSKDEVIDKLRYTAIGDAIRWDYIREFIQEDLGLELIPVVSRFFKAYVKDASGVRVKTSAERIVSPEKYIAQGNGKKTAGYCSIEIDNGVLALRRLVQKKSMTNGVGEAYTNFVNKLNEKNLLTEDNTPRLTEVK